jgi:hypothetical protein
MRSRFRIPVPGMVMFRYTPWGPMFKLNGDAPMVVLRPQLVRFNLTPGMTVKLFETANS